MPGLPPSYSGSKGWLTCGRRAGQPNGAGELPVTPADSPG
jgi:hypothetical protein